MQKNVNSRLQFLKQLLRITSPIIQAPMAGGATTPEFVAAVSNQGCLGSIGAGYLSADQLSFHIQKTKSLTSRIFSVNLFVPEESTVDPEKIHIMQLRLNKFRTELGVPLKESYGPIEDFHKKFQQQIDVVLSNDIKILSFTFGIPPEKIMRDLKDKGVVLIGTATNVTEGKLLEAAGCHAIVAQGVEAGGHRGTFSCKPENAMLGLATFIPQLVDAVNVPVIAAGGIMDGRGVVASLALGASGAQIGTALLTCEESGISATYKQALLAASGEQTQFTDAFSGKKARGIENNFMRELRECCDNPGYPIQHYLTSDIRQAAAAQGRTDLLSLWAGQSVGGKYQTVESVQKKLAEIAKEVCTIFNEFKNIDY